MHICSFNDGILYIVKKSFLVSYRNISLSSSGLNLDSANSDTDELESLTRFVSRPKLSINVYVFSFSLLKYWIGIWQDISCSCWEVHSGSYMYSSMIFLTQSLLHNSYGVYPRLFLMSCDLSQCGRRRWIMSFVISSRLLISLNPFLI